MWKEEGSAQDNVARRNRSVTFSPDQQGKGISYFSVQKPWVQEALQGNEREGSVSPPTKDLDASIQPWEQATLRGVSHEISAINESELSIRTTDESLCETTKAPTLSEEEQEEIPAPPSGEEEEKEEISFEDQPELIQVEDVKTEEARDDEEEEFTEIDFNDVLGKLPTKPSPIISPNRRMSMLSGDIYEPPTSLHALCYNAQTPHDLLTHRDFASGSSPGRNSLKEISTYASQRDSKGRTPLHLISQNHAISGTIYPTDDDTSIPGLQPSPSSVSEASATEKKQVIAFVLDMLLAANPMAMKLQDVNGHIPFERALVEWIHIMHNVESPKSRKWGLGSRRFSSYSRLSAPSRIQHMLHSTSNHVSSAITWAGNTLAFKPSSARSMGTTHTSPKKTDDLEGGRRASDSALGASGDLDDMNQEQEMSDVASCALDHFPSHVHLTSHVRFAICLLSTILDHLDEHEPTRSFRRRSMTSRRSSGSDYKRDSFDVAMDEFRDFCFTESAGVIADDVVREIALIPYLVKTFLLLSDEEEREWVISSTLFRRVIMCDSSIGPWLTGMLQSSKKGVPHRALQYLTYLSDTLEEYPNGWGSQGRKSSSNLFRQTSDVHQELHDKVSELVGFIPSLLALDERKIEEAATTLVVRNVLDRMISKPFAVSIVLFDSIFLFLLILSFRAACRIFLTGGTNGALYWIYVANSCTFYFIIRELGKGITIMERTKRARTYFLSFWTLADILSIFLALSR